MSSLKLECEKCNEALGFSIEEMHGVIKIEPCVGCGKEAQDRIDEYENLILTVEAKLEETQALIKKSEKGMPN